MSANLDFNGILGTVMEDYRRQLICQITAPSIFDTPGEKVYDPDRGYWRNRSHSARIWPEFEIIPGWFRARSFWQTRVQTPYQEAHPRLREAWRVLRHGIPEEDY